MRKGWKTRIDERRYFEDKLEEREAKAAFFKVMKMKIQQDLEELRRDMPKGLYETH